MLIKSKTLKNYKLNSLDGEIGKVKDFYFEDQTWTIKYLIVNTGNWLTGRQVLISPISVVSINKEENYITINLTKSQIENSPGLDCDKPVSKQFEEKYYGYYGFPMYATGMVGAGGAMLPYAPIQNNNAKFKNIKEDNDCNNHLRSSHTVSGYSIQALDDKIGHVDDFIINDETWEIQYLVIDTKNWLPGRNILISIKWIESVSWDESKVFVNLSRDEIKKSPEYTEESILDRDYETRLHKHYNRKAY
ncbi:MAG: PRC-barrel domain-containing protein [Lachnospiraceae bacterium]|nr:PRC-barrel domain-containing protein [Lachnospiraceae bacterium]